MGLGLGALNSPPAKGCTPYRQPQLRAWRQLAKRPCHHWVLPLQPPAVAAANDATGNAGGAGEQYRCRVLTVTDVHADYPRNMQWVKELSDTQHRHDALVVAGDVSDDLELLEEALEALASKFGWVLYTPGNHELWLRQRDVGLQHSLQKLEAVWEICARLGVHTSPTRVGRGLWLVPLLSWHHASFDQEPDLPGPSLSKLASADYLACRWPLELLGPDGSLGCLELAEWFDAQNDSALWAQVLASRQQYDVISFSHFLPSQALLPEKRFLYYSNLPKAVGSLPLGCRLQRLRPDIHIFGHTHFAWDTTIDGVRYIQAPLCSPAERQRRIFTVAFDTCMAEAQADPESASWLPMQVYECRLSAAELPPGSSVRARVHSVGSTLGMQGDASVHSSSVLLSSGSVGGSMDAADDEVVSSIDHAMHGLPTNTEGDSITEPPEDAPMEHGEPPGSPGLGAQVSRIAGGSSSSRSSSIADGGLAAQQDPEGSVRLRHGWAPGNLRAHWSSYYEAHARDPSCMELAPWVQRMHERREHRRVASSNGKEGSAEATTAASGGAN